MIYVSRFDTLSRDLRLLDWSRYVPQIDSLNPNFTVKETLTSAVRLRCADGWADLDTRVHELMEIVGLVSVADLRTGKLTGGQLKLLSVALGLVQRPAVLYLDEPTTGLDSTAASVVMECMCCPNIVSGDCTISQLPRCFA